MAENTLGRNIEFPIYYDVNGTKTPFHDIILRKSVYESSVMGLDDKITGDFYYPNNTLAFSMQEYIEYENVKYYIINPPTIIREGQVVDNSELKGMTKYSVTFYHPMCQLSNMEFTDVAVSNDERQYKSQDKVFYWIGHITDFIAKLNKNLEGTEWVVVQGSSLEGSDKLNELSDVLSFSNEYISDALKRAYDTWGVPFIIVSLHSGEYYDINHIDYYSQEGGSKRFVVIFGLPDNGVYQVDANNSYTLVNGEKQPFIFRLGQGLGLKNNSRTPKNNKIVTRISGYGSERNIPYGYPQIVWHGDTNATCTLGDSIGIKPSITINGHTFTNVMSYPIYEGIVGGQWVKLIKHPFTRTHLMPSIYYETVFNKVSPYLPKNGNTLVYNNNFNPDGTIIDYYDAINDSDYTYIHQINPAAPSTHINEFDEYPRLNSATLPADAIPYQDNPDDSLIGGKGYITYDYFTQVTEEYLSTYNNQTFESALEELLDAMSESQTYGQNEVKGEGYEYYWSYRYETYLIEVEFGFQNEIGITPKNLEFSYKVVRPDVQFPLDWDDTMDEDGTLAQSYFQLTLPQLSFDIYACAAITEKMQINMRSGACIGCTFDIQCDWERYKYAFYDEDGNFAPLGERRMGMLDEFPRSDQGSIRVIAAKDINTFGTPLPSIYQQPKQGDEFVVLGISLPLSYITEAEERLDVKMKDYMLENNIYYYDYPFKFDEFFLATHTGILSQIHNNSRIEFQFGNELVDLYVNKISIKFGDKVLPQYDISFTDNIEVVMSKIGETVNAEVRHTLISNGYEVANQGSSSNTSVTISQSKGNSRDVVMSQAAVTNEIDSINNSLGKYKDLNFGFYQEDTIGSVCTVDFGELTQSPPVRMQFHIALGSDSITEYYDDISLPSELADAITSSDLFNTFSSDYKLISVEADDFEDKLYLHFGHGNSSNDIPEAYVAEVISSQGGNPQNISSSEDITGYAFFTTPEEYHGGHYFIKEDTEKGYVDMLTNTIYRWNGSEYMPLGSNIEVDDEPTEGSTNAVSSGGVWNGLQGKVDKKIDTYTFEDVIALTASASGATTQAAGTFYFIKVKPTDYDKPVRIRFHIVTYVPTDANFLTDSYVDITFIRSALSTYAVYNAILSTSYRPVYYYTTYTAKTKAVAEATGHLIGISLYNATNPRNSSKKRSGTVELISIEGGTYTWIETPTLFADLDVTGTTNYATLSNTSAASTGLQETGDSNTVVTYGTMDYYFRPYAAENIYRYKLLLQGEDNRMHPVVITNQTTNNRADAAWVANMIPTSAALRPYNVWFYATTTTISAGSVISAQTLHSATYSTANAAQYTFNTALPAYRMVYLRGTYNKDTDLFTLYNDGSSPCTSYYTTAPTNTANITLSDYFVSGYYYLLVGGTYSSADYLQLFAYNPFYYFDGTNLIPVSTKVANDAVSGKQDTLVSGENIKTINGESILGEGNLVVSSQYPQVYDELTGMYNFPDNYVWVYDGQPITQNDLDANEKTESEIGAIGFPDDFFTGLADGIYDGFYHGEPKTYGTSPSLLIPECVLRLVGYERNVSLPVDNTTMTFDLYLFRTIVRKSNRAKDFGVDIQIMYRYDSVSDEGRFWILGQETSSISVDSELSSISENPVQNKKVYEALQGKQDTLVSGTNIATINGNSLLNGGNIVISGGTSLVTYNCVQIFNTPIGQDLVSPYLTAFTIDDMLDDIRDNKANLVITSSFNLPSYSSNPTKVTFSFVLQQGGSKKDYSFVLFYDEIDEYNERSVRHFVTIIDDEMGHWEVASKDEAYRYLNDDDRPMTTAEINAILV